MTPPSSRLATGVAAPHREKGGRGRIAGSAPPPHREVTGARPYNDIALGGRCRDTAPGASFAAVGPPYRSSSTQQIWRSLTSL